MNVRYDPMVDAMYIKLQDGEYEISEESVDGVIMDFDKSKRLLGIEILDVSKLVSRSNNVPAGAQIG